MLGKVKNTCITSFVRKANNFLTNQSQYMLLAHSVLFPIIEMTYILNI